VFTIDDNLVVFLKDNEVVMTCFLANMLFFEPAPAETSRQDRNRNLGPLPVITLGQNHNSNGGLSGGCAFSRATMRTRAPITIV
jgi:hypothetical protein